MAYNGDAVQNINRYYFRTKTEGDYQYDIVYNIMNLMGVLPIALWIGFAIFSIIFILPYTTTLLEKLSLSQLQEAKSLMSKLKNAKVIPTSNLPENKSECDQEIYLIELKSNLPEDLKKDVSEMAKNNRFYVKQLQEEHNKYVMDLSSQNKWKIDDEPFLGLSICLNLALLGFHITSYVYNINYAEDVLVSARNRSFGPIVSAAFSIIIILITYILAVGLYICKLSNRCSSCDQPSFKTNPVILFTAMSIMVNIIHLVCYFMPYMLLAFIYNPLQTFVTYLVLGVYVLCGYLLLWILKRLLFYCCKHSDPICIGHLSSKKIYKNQGLQTNSKTYVKPRYICIAYSMILLGIFFSIVYFSFVLIYILTWGSYDDIEVIQNLVPPLLIGMLTYFVVKPTYKQAKQKISLDDGSRMAKLLKDKKGVINIRETDRQDN